MSDFISDDVRNSIINRIVEGKPTQEKSRGLVEETSDNIRNKNLVKKKVIEDFSPTTSWTKILQETLTERSDHEQMQDRELDECREEVIEKCDLDLITRLF